ncbi:MAG: MoxR family ATPase [Eubacterium sp.]|nr:MoxR family ATPase [Eubacterium sp.]
MSELSKNANAVINEVKKVVVGKEDVIELIMTAILANGHILMEDVPGVGKTTMAVAFSKAMGIEEKRVQFTPDIMPSDLTGFSMYQKETGQFKYQPGLLMCNLFLADEINRTSPKTQSALLEVMEERKITVDGVSRVPGNPFIVIATQNPEGSAGTQLLPESQLDRFMVCMNIGYPTVEEEAEIIKRRQSGNPTEDVEAVIRADQILEMQKEVKQVFMNDEVLKYIARLAEATRNNDMLMAGISPRGTVALAAMSRANAWLKGRDYVIPQDVLDIFFPVARHRIRLTLKAKVGNVTLDQVLEQTVANVDVPVIRKK